jgi:divalent metal cation (Fe/Co/Zn/Cd) transporter
MTSPVHPSLLRGAAPAIAAKGTCCADASCSSAASSVSTAAEGAGSLAGEVGGRAALLRRAKHLTWLTIGWNVIEGVVALSAALAAGSVALVGFGVDSFVESSSGAVMLWRLWAEGRAADKHAVERLDHRARKLIALSLLGLAAFVAFDAATTLWKGERPESSAIGIGLTLLSIVVMQWLARAKRRTAAALGSRAMAADAFQTTACFWLSIITLTGIGLNAAFGWWWADPAAAIGMTVFLAKEGRAAWRGEDCC